ncbi:YjcZ family sporulation protein [Metabacillus litoralis]|nr:YjcZ family sporulation protein [Metabacillus litoralis]
MSGYAGNSFALIVVLFILLIIVGSAGFFTPTY